TRNQYVWTPAYIDGLVVKLTDSAGDGTYETRHYALTDANWNVTAITDGSGVVLERFVSDPYGRFDVYNADWSTLQPSGSAYAWDYFHQGGRYDYATGFFHFRNRDYSPTLMRWVGMDPIGFEGGDSTLFRYEADNPVNRSDPSGLQSPFPHITPGYVAGEICKQKANPPRPKECDTKFDSFIDEHLKSCCPPDKLEKAKGVLKDMKAKASFSWPHTKGPLGKCGEWMDAYMNMVLGGDLKQRANEVSECIKGVDKVTMDNYALQIGPPVAIGLITGGLGFFAVGGAVSLGAIGNAGVSGFFGANIAGGMLKGAGHNAVRVTLCDGSVFYMDDGNMGSCNHVFYDSDIPAYYGSPRKSD
ncbi:MAG: RHS repeat-associated core domain-containing protein, partial [Nitrospira sp.]|nr:RHS repeat-associated core domain-containing protein [Nitrospira sp.]